MSIELLPYKQMYERMDALERLELKIRWGAYDIHVLRFHLVQFAPGKAINFHMHAEYEFHFIPGGKGFVIMQDRHYPLSAGQFYLTGPGLLHYQEADMNEPMEELCLHIDIIERDDDQTDPAEALEARNCIEKLKTLPPIPAHDVYNAMNSFVEAYQATQNYSLGSYMTIKQAIIQILLRVVRVHEQGNEQISIPIRDMKQYRYKLALEYIHTNYAQPISIEDVAEKLRVSTRQLQRLLKELNDGKTFSKTVEEIRLAAVCKHLLSNESSIEKIALQCGFSSGNYLHTVFKEKFGVTPAQYRAAYKNN
ncbi:AraC family transcriptional regulator [Paenibacillus yanchengensis]|uniref:AraC family transcriptional regulator n=1 Tax=Paenibacillus yanchengensis TaxID=2035833 RepID=A0ABW4YFE3_9BACL